MMGKIKPKFGFIKTFVPGVRFLARSGFLAFSFGMRGEP
jgi:hypothetical protein